MGRGGWIAAGAGGVKQGGEMRETEFFLMRHAKTEWNLTKRIQGQANSPLSREGEEQAKRWAGLLKEIGVQGIITSDLGRAKQTARPIAANLSVPVETDERLREQDWGEWTGDTLRGLQERIPEELENQVASGWEFCPPGGESRLTVWERSRRALISAAEERPGEKLLVIAHQGVIKALVYRLTGRRFLPSEPPILKPYHLHELTRTKEGLVLKRLNSLKIS